MKKAYLFPLKTACNVLENGSIDLLVSDSVEDRVEQLWMSGRSTKMLFDQPVLSVRSYQESNIFVTCVPYKICFAAILDCVLRRQLSVYPLAVCGRTICNGAVLLARRSSNMAFDADLFECCPSGGVSSSYVRDDHSVDIQAAIVQEFLEETRFPLATIISIEPKYCVWTVTQGVFDICFDIKLDPNAILPLANAEYVEFRWWRPGDSMNGIVAPSVVLLEQYADDI